jgi:hypothetical protein
MATRVSTDSIARDGYAITERVLSDHECSSLLRLIEPSNVGRSRAGARHLMSSPVVADLSRDDRLLRLAVTALNREAVPFRATLFDKSDDANWSVVWHQDTAFRCANGSI